MDTRSEVEKDRAAWRTAFWFLLLIVCPLSAFVGGYIGMGLGRSAEKLQNELVYTREVGRMIHALALLEKEGKQDVAAARLQYMDDHWYCVGREDRFEQFREEVYAINHPEDYQPENDQSHD